MLNHPVDLPGLAKPATEPMAEPAAGAAADGKVRYVAVTAGGIRVELHVEDHDAVQRIGPSAARQIAAKQAACVMEAMIAGNFCDDAPPRATKIARVQMGPVAPEYVEHEKKAHIARIKDLLAEDEDLVTLVPAKGDTNVPVLVGELKGCVGKVIGVDGDDFIFKVTASPFTRVVPGDIRILDHRLCVLSDPERCSRKGMRAKARRAEPGRI